MFFLRPMNIFLHTFPFVLHIDMISGCNSKPTLQQWEATPVTPMIAAAFKKFLNFSIKQPVRVGHKFYLDERRWVPKILAGSIL